MAGEGEASVDNAEGLLRIVKWSSFLASYYDCDKAAFQGFLIVSIALL